MPINTVQDVLDSPICSLTEPQFNAFIDGRDAYRRGDTPSECYYQFHDTKLCWQAGYQWEGNKR